MASKQDKWKKELQEIRVILIGKTGAGKSTLGNALLGREFFHSSFAAESVTTNCDFGKQEITSKSRKYTLKVIDTPGLMDTRLPEEETCGELVKSLSLVLPGPHVFVIVLKMGRFTNEEFEVVELVKKEFGDGLMDFAVVVFTHGSQLKGKPIEEFLTPIPPSLKKILEESHNRYAVLVDNSDKNFQKSVQNIIDLIVDSLELRYYTNDMFKKADEKKRIIIEKIEEEKNREIMVYKKEIEELKKKERERLSKDRKKEIKEEKQRKEMALRKTETTTSEDVYDISVKNDASNSVAQETFSETVMSAVGGMVATGVGFFTGNAVVAGQGIMTTAKSAWNLFSR